MIKWTAAIDLAIAMTEGRAGHSPDGGITYTGEELWRWPSCPLRESGDSGWWYVPRRIADRARRLCRQATLCESARGPCGLDDVARRLRRWQRSRRWQRRCLRDHEPGARRAGQRRAPEPAELPLIHLEARHLGVGVATVVVALDEHGEVVYESAPAPYGYTSAGFRAAEQWAADHGYEVDDATA